MSGVDEPTVAELVAAVRTMSSRIEHLEAELRAVRAELPKQEVPDDVLVAISAAVAGFLGHRAKLKQVHYRTGQAWAQQGRVAVQGRQVIHGVR